MKTMIVTAMLLMASVGSAQGFEVQATPTAKRWMCEATGKLPGSGFPGGDQWQRVTAFGNDQLDAARNALDRCFSMGLRECRVGGCWQR